MVRKPKSRDPFFEYHRNVFLALTYDDVRLKARYSEVMPFDVCLESKFSKNIGLKVPIVSAAMDTVTGYKMATELAKQGGLGVIHRNFSPERQALEVKKVKTQLNAKTGLIEAPEVVYESDTIEEIINRCRLEGYTFDSFPVLNKHKQLTGILTGRDFNYCDDPKLYASDLMTTNVITVNQDDDYRDAYNLMSENKIPVIPIVTDNHKIIGMYSFKDLRALKQGDYKNYNIDSKGRLMVAAAIGVGKDVCVLVDKLVEQNVDALVIDTAHAHTKSVGETLETLKGSYEVDIIAGNVSEAKAVEYLINLGADGVKVGQGPGSICKTRDISGIGKPQVSAIDECVRISEEIGDIPICADGGIVFPGDITIAIAAGAQSVMLGSVLAVAKEAPGDIITLGGIKYKEYRGMGSLGAMKAGAGARDRYNQNGTTGKFITQGVEGRVRYKGPLEEIVFDYVGGLREGMGLTGSKKIQELRDDAEFIRITNAGRKESSPHNIFVTKE